MACGGFGHTLCLTEGGQIFAWGLNVKGQVGLGDLPELMKTSQGDIAYTKACYKPVQLKRSTTKEPLPLFSTIACGFCSSFAIDVDGNAWVWGGGNIGFKDVNIVF